MPETVEISREELKALKRDAAIRAKEDEFERRREEEEERKRVQLQELRIQYERQEQEKVQEQVKRLEKQAQARALKKARLEQLNQKREAKIEKRHEAWLQKANAEILDIKADHEGYLDELEKRWQDARTAKAEREQMARDKSNNNKGRSDELNRLREENEAERKTARELRGIYRADMLKSEATEELESFILNPYPVPLKQVLAGKLRPVPTVTKLLAEYKDQRENLKELEEMDIPTRVLIHNSSGLGENKSVFQYVRELQMKAEAERIKPPEPQPADLGRSRKGASSPKGKFRQTGSKMQGTR